MLTGSGSIMITLIVCDAVLAGTLLSVTVIVGLTQPFVGRSGTPLTTPVDGSNVSPSGSVPLVTWYVKGG
jgi:hypothetical protein